MTQNASIPAPNEVDEAPRCRHHWVIQPATGPVSLGKCQLCSELREFKNYVEGAAWGDSRLANRAGREQTPEVSRAVADLPEGEDEE